VTTVAVVGLGDLGSRVLDTLARSPRVERLIGATRDRERGDARVHQCRLVAAIQGGPRHVEFHRISEVGDAAAIDADVIVTAATRHTWWKPSPAGVPYGAWLPLQLTLVRDLMRAGPRAPVVCLPFPDAVGPALAPLGLAPAIGAGNVGETAPKLALLSGGDVRLVMHHAVQRYAFPSFGVLGDTGVDAPPWAAELLVDGEPLAHERVAELLRAPWPLPPGTATHDLTAASTAQIVEALLGDEPVRAHAPAPGGRAGGYPVRIASGRVELDLWLPESEAIAINERAARWDGLDRVEADGTLVFTPEIADTAERILGVRLDRVAPHDLDAVADALEQARDRRG
jgi:hypothetical protein